MQLGYRGYLDLALGERRRSPCLTNGPVYNHRSRGLIETNLRQFSIEHGSRIPSFLRCGPAALAAFSIVAGCYTLD